MTGLMKKKSYLPQLDIAEFYAKSPYPAPTGPKRVWVAGGSGDTFNLYDTSPATVSPTATFDSLLKTYPVLTVSRDRLEHMAPLAWRPHGVSASADLALVYLPGTATTPQLLWMVQSKTYRFRHVEEFLDGTRYLLFTPTGSAVRVMHTGARRPSNIQLDEAMRLARVGRWLMSAESGGK